MNSKVSESDSDLRQNHKLLLQSAVGVLNLTNDKFDELSKMSRNKKK